MSSIAQLPYLLQLLSRNYDLLVQLDARFVGLIPTEYPGSTGHTADVYRKDGKRFTVLADDKLTAFSNLNARLRLTRRIECCDVPPDARQKPPSRAAREGNTSFQPRSTGTAERSSQSWTAIELSQAVATRGLQSGLP
jgi:hypothetical protein